jgi:hypothetical protein
MVIKYILINVDRYNSNYNKETYEDELELLEISETSSGFWSHLLISWFIENTCEKAATWRSAEVESYFVKLTNNLTLFPTILL